jgi:hypothetical protein
VSVVVLDVGHRDDGHARSHVPAREKRKKEKEKIEKKRKEKKREKEAVNKSLRK